MEQYISYGAATITRSNIYFFCPTNSNTQKLKKVQISDESIEDIPYSYFLHNDLHTYSDSAICHPVRLATQAGAKVRSIIEMRMVCRNYRNHREWEHRSKHRDPQHERVMISEEYESDVTMEDLLEEMYQSRIPQDWVDYAE